MKRQMADSTQSAEGSGVAAEPLRFIFITSFAEIPFFEPVKKGMQDAAQQLNVRCEFTGPGGMDTAAQADMARQAIADGYHGIVLNIFEAAGLAAVIDQAADAGIPVAAFNVDDQSAPTRRLFAVCQNLFKAGQVLGRKAASFVADGSRIFIVMHDRGVSALEQRCEGIVHGLQDKNITWDIVIGGDRDHTVKVLTERLQAEPDVKVVLCTGQSDTEGAGLTIQKSFPGQDYQVAGFDLSLPTLQMVKDGTISFVIDQQPYVQGYYPVVQLTHYCRYGIVPSSIDAGHNVIDSQNAGQVIAHSKTYYR